MEIMEVHALIRKLTKHPIAFSPIFAEIAGCAASGLFLSQCFYWHENVSDDQPDRDGWFYKSAEEWKRETYLSRREMENARESLKEKGILEEKKEGVPCRLYYRLNVEALFSRMIAINGDEQSSLSHASKLGCNGVANKPAHIEQTPIKTETTSKITTESSARPSKARPTVEELKAYCVEKGFPASDGEILFDKWTGTGWRNGNAPIMDWRATVRSWIGHNYMPSQKAPRFGHQRSLPLNGADDWETAKAEFNARKP